MTTAAAVKKLKHMPPARPLFLDRNLLEPSDERRRPGDFGATLEAHGLYNTFHFVLRLSPIIHRKLDSLPAGIIPANNLDFAGAQAHSTYLHETIHWWQHIGSTYGFMLSLAFPAGLQANYRQLKQLIADAGFKKSIRTLARDIEGPSGPETIAGLANIIINNQFDFAAFQRLTYGRASRLDVLKEPMFQGVGHAFSIAWANNVLILAGTCDQDFEAMRHPKDWEPYFEFLRGDDAGPEFDHSLFKRSARVPVFRVGAFEIMEGQARFGQLQYLYFGSGGQVDWEEFEASGLLGAPYVDAFDEFLSLTKLVRPETFDHPIVALFLLICDMALNPGAGFPFPLRYPAAFVADIDPGQRFDLLCRLVRLKCPHLATAIQGYTRAEFQAASDELAAVAKFDAPLAIAAEFAAWPTRSSGISTLMEEYLTFEFGALNYPIRLLFSHFLAFMQDKHERPEVFCWPGAWLAGTRVVPAIAGLLDRHGALFVDKADDDGIFPRLREDRDEAAVYAAFNTFYGAVVTYDMVEQWITRDGPFQYDYDWLSQTGSKDELKAFADRLFASTFGIQPDAADLLIPQP